jgi:di/tricarboxylate transporter
VSADAWITLFTIVACFGALSLTRLPADVILLGGVGVLMLLDVLSVQSALIGFSNEGVATVGVLYVVAHALTAAGAVEWLSSGMLGRPKSLRMAQLRLMVPVAFFSSILNNTPVVAMMVPVVTDWSRRTGHPASQLMMPLSFAAIIGGICTLIGTSTNLVINGMLTQLDQETDLAIFDLVWVGVPCVIAVVVFILLFSRHLLPFKLGAARSFEDTRQYTVEMLVEPGSPLAGRSIEDAGLRHLPGLYLAEIVRGKRVIGRVSPTVHLHAEDRLVFVGNVDAVVELKKITGLVSAEDQVFKLDQGGTERSLVEVVIAPEFPLLGKSVREGNFRKYYGAVIIAVARDGVQIKQRIGDMELRPGDTLLLETNSEFVRKQRFSRDFLVVSPVADFHPARHRKRWVAIALLLGMVLSVGFGLVDMFKAAMLAAALMIVTGCCTMDGARRSISWQVLAAIAASLALGKAMQDSGLAELIAMGVVESAAGSPLLTMLALFTITAVFSALITNVAAAVLVFPIAVAASQDLGVSVVPYAITLMVAASASFSTPIGYQTNMMVWGPGEYRFVDFVKLGVPLTILVGIVTMIVVPVVWPF